ncbi:lipoprotein localization factor LolB, partial [Burkholderia pseudomallei]
MTTMPRFAQPRARGVALVVAAAAAVLLGACATQPPRAPAAAPA